MSEAGWHDLGSVENLLDESLRGALVHGRRLCVGRTGDAFFAIDDTCPHAGGSLSEGMIDVGQVICPLHAYAFETKTGQCLDDPECGVTSYPVRIHDDTLQVYL